MKLKTNQMKISKLLSKTMLLCAVLFLVTFFTHAQIEKTASVEGITEYKLDNGLKVLLFPDNSSQTITVNMTYKVGSKHEGYGEKGMAHLLEHLVFKGTPSHPNIPKELTDHGARPNGTTWYDRTNYFETFNATDENLDWALDLEADRMVNSYIAKKDLESEFSVVRNEFEMGENSPSGVLLRNVVSAAYVWHNYGQSTIGNRSDIERVPIENLKAFYKKYYRPDNAVLMVTGKFNAKKTLALIVGKYGSIKNPIKPLIDVPTIEPPQDGERRVNLNRVGNLQIVSALYHTPAGSHEDYAAIAIAENVLTSQPSGRVYKALVDKKKASGLWSFSPFTKEPSFLYINIDVPSDKSLTEAEDVFLSVLDNVSKKNITDKELKRAKANLLKEIDQISRNSSRLGTFMSEFIGAGDWRLRYIHRDRVEAMTLDKVNAAVKNYFIPTNRTVGNFVPTKKPVTVGIEHTNGLNKLVTSYKGRERLNTGEAFDVSYDNIQKRLNSGELEKLPIEYGFIKKDNRGKTVKLSFKFRTGNVNDFMNNGRVASYTAKMLNKGTTTRSRQAIKDKLSALKSTISFNGDYGEVTAHVNTTEEYLMECLAIMTDMLKKPKFDQVELDKIKNEDLAKIEENKSDPRYLVGKNMGLVNQNYKKGHPLYVPTIEEEVHNIDAVTIKAVQKHYNTFYGISNSATITAIGNLNETEIKNYFQKEFADFKSDKNYVSIADNHFANKITNEIVRTPGKKNAVTLGVLNFKGSQTDDDYAALQIAGAIFGGGFLNSRIANRLRQKDGVSYGAGARVRVDENKDDNSSSMLVYAIYAPQNAVKVQEGFKEETERFIKDGITEEELKGAVKGWVQGKNVSRAKDGELRHLIENNLYYDRDMPFHKTIEDRVVNLTVNDVNKVIKKYFKTFDKWTVINAGDFKNTVNLKRDKIKN